MAIVAYAAAVGPGTRGGGLIREVVRENETVKFSVELKKKVYYYFIRYCI